MPETVIELDLSSPWEPPEPPRTPLRSGPLPRWVAAGTVLAVALGTLVAAGARPRTGPLYRIQDQVLNVTVAGDMLLVGRYQMVASEPKIEGRRRSDGELLWSVPTDLQQHYAAVSAGALIILRHSTADRGYASTLVAIDVATGRTLWTRPRASLVGVHGDRVVVEDMPDRIEDAQDAQDAQEAEAPDAGDQDPEQVDDTINRAGYRHERHVLVLDERTGRTVWELTAAPGSALTFTMDGRYPTGQVTGIDQLDPSGLVTRRDVRTGAVVATRQLAWSGIPAWFHTGAARPGGGPGPAADRVVVYPDGQRGGIVFDLADGRTLFRTDTAVYDGLYQCAATLFCANTGNGIAAYDSTTGRSLWRLDGYTDVIAAVGDRLVVGSFDRELTADVLLATADARTGAVIRALSGWRLLLGAGGDRILLWRAVDQRTAILGELDPATGHVTVFARAEDWYGPPECSVDGDTLACVMVGDATVWRLPARR